jgi:hypothetical protein
MTVAAVAAPSTAPDANALSLKDIMIRLADEGVPVRVVARVTKIDSEYIRLRLQEALEAGRLLQLPRDDWPSNTSRETREPGFSALQRLHPDLLMMHTCRLFGLTKLQASFFLTLIKRRDVTRAGMHQVIESRRHSAEGEETDQKMVDVVVCHTRKKLKKFNITITTVWSCGYRLDNENRDRALKLLTDFVNQNETVPA